MQRAGGSSPAFPTQQSKCSYCKFQIHEHYFPLVDWGADHPDKRESGPKMKVQWTAEERRYVADWLRNHPNGTSRALYHKVLKCSRARRIFHHNHVLTHERLLHMYKEIKG
jgi:hypothetical protein